MFYGQLSGMVLLLSPNNCGMLLVLDWLQIENIKSFFPLIHCHIIFNVRFLSIHILDWSSMFGPDKPLMINVL